MSKEEKQRKATVAAQKIMDFLIERLLSFKNGRSWAELDRHFGFGINQSQYIVNRQRCYKEPSLITIIQLAIGLRLNEYDLQDCLKQAGFATPSISNVTLPAKFRHLKKHDRDFLIKFASDYIDTHAVILDSDETLGQ